VLGYSLLDTVLGQQEGELGIQNICCRLLKVSFFISSIMLNEKKSIVEIPLHRSVVSILKSISALFLISACILTACSPASDQLPATAPTSAIPTQSDVLIPPTLVDSIDNSYSLAQPTQDADGAIACNPAGNAAPLLDGSFDTFPQAIRQFLNTGGSVEELAENLYALGIANQPVSVDAADMTGSEFEEVIVSIFDPGSTNLPPAGMLLIYSCIQQEYNLVYQDDSRPDGGAPGIRFLQDLDADDLSELVISSASCGAHTCFEQIQVVGWDGQEWINRLVGQTDDLPYPTIYIIPSENEEIYDLHVSGSGLGSVGAGPQRNITRIWSMDEDTRLWQISSLRLEPSNYRIHVLHDAVGAAKEGNYQQALMLYQRVVSDTTLDDWLDPALEQAWISAFAHYQQVVIYTILEREAFANTILGEMERAYPPESQQFGYVDMALSYLGGYLEGGKEKGCTAALRYATEHPGILDPLGQVTFGYGNPTFSPADLCP
jgi:hypothetical protein